MATHFYKKAGSHRQPLEPKAFSSVKFVKKNDEVTQMYNDFKQLVKTCIFEAIDNDQFHPDDTIIVIDLGSTEDSNPPYINLSHGKSESDGWSQERTLRQYILKTSYTKGNIPKNVLCETIRYSHTDPDISESKQLKEISDSQIFHPVISEKIVFGENRYVIMSKILRDDTAFLKLLNDKVKRHNPNYYIESVYIQGDGSSITVNQHPVNLSHEYYKLVLREKKPHTEQIQSTSLETNSTVV